MGLFSQKREIIFKEKNQGYFFTFLNFWNSWKR